MTANADARGAESRTLAATGGGMAPVCEDLSAFVIAGRVKGSLNEPPVFETAYRTPAQGIDDGVEAERLGFRRVFAAERLDLKDPAVLLGGIAARTSRLGVGTGLIGAGTRHPMHLATLGATMQAAYGERFVLGLGRGVPAYVPGGNVSFEAFADICTILNRLWAGERVEYDGPAGSFGELQMQDLYEGQPPEIWYGGFGLQRSAQTAARTPAIDGFLIPAPMTDQAVAKIVATLRTECERAGRDPATLRVAVELITAPELSEAETRALAHARVVTYLEPPAWGRPFEALNDWDPAVVQRMREHPLLDRPGHADSNFHRVELAAVTELVPDEWVEDSCAVGSVANCVQRLQAYIDAGVDEILVKGSTPVQNAGLIAAWREHRAR